MNIYLHCLCAFVIRLCFILYSRIQDVYSEVKYTDIDYQIFTDAANHVWNGDSPFKRPTYRYSPILAYILTPNIFFVEEFGKFLFAALDIVTSLLIYHIQYNYYKNVGLCKKCAFLWLYNPMAIIISTRGSSESVMTSLIMFSLLLYVKKRHFFFGLLYGFSVHMKIYPCIYAITFYFVLSDSVQDVKGWVKFKKLFYPNKQKCIFVISSALGFIIPTISFIYLYRDEYLNEALIYHLKRKDVKHNFSPYFYLLYLSDTISPFFSSVISISSFLIQFFLVSLISWVFYLPQTLPSCLFIETFTFVTFNKVCTSQYFLWYLCLFPLCYPLLANYHKKVLVAFAAWMLGQALWLSAAYHLEFKGVNTFYWIFLASLIFFVINVYLICKYFRIVLISVRQPIKNVKLK